jgi:hypothetical protein
MYEELMLEPTPAKLVLVPEVPALAEPVLDGEAIYRNQLEVSSTQAASCF